MRLQLIALLALTATARAEPEGDTATVVARTSGYVDNDHTEISTTTIAVRAKPTDKAVVSAHYTADAVSSASVDVITAATERWTELRSEVQGGLAWVDSKTTVSADYIYSHEHDWDSHTVSLGGSHDVLHHNLTLGAGFSYGTNAVGRADDMTFSEQMDVVGGALRAVWTATKNDILQTSYDLSRVSGYQSSPYRHAFAMGPAGTRIAFPETTPDLRMRHALTLRWNHHLLDDAALRSHVRIYADDWGLASVTTGTEFVLGFEPFEVAASVRLYAQHHARFYQDVYDAPRAYMTADRELSTFQDVFAGLRGRWQHGDSLSLDASVMGFYFRFPEFSRLPSRLGLTVGIGLVWAL
jgi:hypothetical protein